MFLKSSRNRSVKWFSSCIAPTYCTQNHAPTACWTHWSTNSNLTSYNSTSSIYHSSMWKSHDGKFTKPHRYMWRARSRLSPLDVMKWCSSRVLGTGLWNGSHHVLPRPLAHRIMHQQPAERTEVPIVIWHHTTQPIQSTIQACGNHMMASSLNHTDTCDMQGLGSAP